jgi:hypothetical protein
VRIGIQVLFEPVARFEIEVIRRLVQEQQIRLAEQQLRERDPHLPAAGKRLGLALEIRRLEPEALQHRRRLQLDAVAVVHAEGVLQIAVAMEHPVVLRRRDRVVAQPLLERVHLGLHREQLAERGRRLLEYGPTGVRQAVLRQVADGQRGRRQDRARVGLVEASHHPQQRGFSGAVRPAEADALAIRNLPGDVIEEDAVAEGLGEFLKLNHAKGLGAVTPPAPLLRLRAPEVRGTAW